MSGVAIVLSFQRVSGEDGKGTDVNVDTGGDTFTVDHFGVPGIDAPPMAGDTVALSESHGAGAEQAVGYEDTRNAGQSLGGEVRIYARSSGGAPICSVFLRRDGRVQMSNAEGAFEMAADGKVTINGVEIDTDGNISAPGEVTAKAGGLPGTSVTLSQHTHPVPGGTSSAPNGGT